MWAKGQSASLRKFLLQDSSVSALELIVASLKSFQVAAEAGNFAVQEFLQRSKARSFIATNQVCECYAIPI